MFSVSLRENIPTHLLLMSRTTTSILIGAEKYLYPAEWLLPYYEQIKSPTSYAYINSGIYMGRAGDLSAALTRAEVYDIYDDQLAWQLSQLDNPGTVQLDSYTDMVNNMYLSCDEVSLREYRSSGTEAVSEGGFVKMRPFNSVTKTYPAILHFNGASTGECSMDFYQRTAWWWNGAYNDKIPQDRRKAELQKRNKKEAEFEIFLLTPSLRLTRTRFTDICPPRQYF